MKWLSVKDSLPPDYVDVLVYIPPGDSNGTQLEFHVIVASMGTGVSGARYWDSYRPNPGVTHWMPLPAPPTRETK